MDREKYLKEAAVALFVVRTVRRSRGYPDYRAIRNVEGNLRGIGNI